jgi:hypothetical protein
MISIKTAILRAAKLFLDSSNLEVVGWGPRGPVMIDPSTGEAIKQIPATGPPAGPEQAPPAAEQDQTSSLSGNGGEYP